MSADRSGGGPVKVKTFVGLVAIVAVAAVGCGRSSSDLSQERQAAGTSTSTAASAEACAGATLEATDVGVTAEEISIEVMADIGSPLAPGLFQSNVDAIEAFAEAVNANGGVGCRRLVVDVWDSKLDPTEAKNGQVAGCENDLALVGGSALFNPDVVTQETCPDQAGQPVGIPNFAAVANDTAEQCARTTWNLSSVSVSCDGPQTGTRTFNIETGSSSWLNEQNGGDLTGIYLVPGDLPSTAASATYFIQGQREAGIDIVTGAKTSGRATQSDLTRYVQLLRTTDSDYVYGGGQGSTMVKMRKEAAAQGLDTIEVWACTVACYNEAYVAEGAVVDDTWVVLPNLPLEEPGDNESIHAYVDAVADPDSFGSTAWMAGMLFKETIDRIVEADGPNAITRAKVIETMMAIDDFDAGGWIGPKGPKSPQECYMVVQLTDGVWQRRYPDAPGTLRCDPITSVTIDPEEAVDELQ